MSRSALKVGFHCERRSMGEQVSLWLHLPPKASTSMPFLERTQPEKHSFLSSMRRIKHPKIFSVESLVDRNWYVSVDSDGLCI